MFEIDGFPLEEDFEDGIFNGEDSFANSFSSGRPTAKTDNRFGTIPQPQHIAQASTSTSRILGKCRPVFHQTERVVRQRKFPGPAGLLPQRTSNTSLVATEEFLDDLEKEAKNDQEFEDKEILSQCSGTLFDTSETWLALLEDLDQSGKSLIDSLNLALFPKVLKRNPRGCKIPFLAVMVLSIDSLMQDPFLQLKDNTGEMPAILHRDVWENWNAEIKPGSALVLRNVGLITVGTSMRKHIINVTENNITAIYFTKTGKNDVVQSKIMNPLPNISDSFNILEEWDKIVENLPKSITPIRQPQPRLSSPLFNLSRVGQPASEPLQKKFCKQVRNLDPVRNPLPNGKTLQNKPAVQNRCRPNDSLTTSNRNTQFSRSNGSGLYTQKENTSFKPTDPLRTINQNLFQVEDCDTSMVESLLDGLDTDAFFCDF